MNQAIVEDLVTASHILADQGVLDGLGHISVRHPDNPQRYLMSRSLAPALVTPADIMEYDLDSNAIDRQGRSLFLERFIHGETYRARPDVFAVIHSHSPTVIPFSISRTPLRPVFNGAAFLSPSAPVFDIRKTAGMTRLADRHWRIGQGAQRFSRRKRSRALARAWQRRRRRNSAAGCLPSDSDGAQRPLAASGDDARRAVDLYGAGRSIARPRERVLEEIVSHACEPRIHQRIH